MSTANPGKARLFKALPLALLLAAAAVPAGARFLRTWEPVPLPRLLENVGKQVEKKPEDAAAHYTLGRLHSLGFARAAMLGEIQVDVVLKKGGMELPLPGFPPYDTVLQKPQNPYRTLPEPAREHLLASLTSYRKATELAPKDALYWLGYGWMLEQGLPWAETLKAPFLDELRKGAADNWRENTLQAYRTAYSLSATADLKRPAFGPGGDASIALESGEGLLRSLAPVATTEKQKAELAEVTKTVAALRSKPRAITPIVFPLTRSSSLEALIDSSKATLFDMAGDGQPERWPWLKPGAAFLVWDPEGTGMVRSGRQFFGSATWSMIWRNGYEPLAALDNNRDGTLKGRELKGLAAWEDRNGDGISQPGEVTALSVLGITTLSVKGTYRNGVLGNPRGIGRTDGSWLPTYDWMPTPAQSGARPR